MGQWMFGSSVKEVNRISEYINKFNILEIDLEADICSESEKLPLGRGNINKIEFIIEIVNLHSHHFQNISNSIHLRYKRNLDIPLKEIE
jgi:hypothetical protein